VGTQRRPLGLQLGEQYFIGPDNGLFTLVLEHAEFHSVVIKIFHLNQSYYWLPEVSRVFHGRDIFAPVAAHLATGTSLIKMGVLINDPVRLEIQHPEPIRGGGWRGQVIEIDTFGNLSTNIYRSLVDPLGEVQVLVADHQIIGLVDTFGDRPQGTLIALYGTTHDLTISIVNGDAAHTLNLSIGDIVEVYPVNKGLTQ
jgi:hypothetical protein